jgi:putative two-component system response regulator
MTETNQTPSILLVDDTEQNISVLKSILSPNYIIRAATNGELALKIADKFKPDLILLDVMMPGMDGYEVCLRLKANPETADIPVIFVTALSESVNEERGFEVGAIDYLTKPVVPVIVEARVKTHLALSDQQRACKQMVIQRTKELEESQKSAIFMLGTAGHYNDTDTGVHIWRVAAFSAALARAANWPIEQANLLEMAAAMHDTGKIGIPDEILKAPRRLTEEEMTLMKTHADIGHLILSKSETPLFQMAAEVAQRHHEKWDGSGYPDGLKGEEIPESARIVAIADVFDALTMKRPYKEAWPIETALEEIKKSAGSHFDPELVDRFFEIKDEILELKNYWDSKEK